MSTIHERPGVYSEFSATQSGTVSDYRIAAIIAPADAAEGIHLIHTAQEAKELYGVNAMLYRLLKLCLANYCDSVYAIAVAEDTAEAYRHAIEHLFSECNPGFVVVGSARKDVHLVLRDAAEANAFIGLSGLKNATVGDYLARSAALCCERVVLVAPDVLPDEEAIADSFCGAAAIAGFLASLSNPALPLHNIALHGLQTNMTTYHETELDELLKGGVTPIQLRNGKPHALRIVTTRAADSSAEGTAFRDLSAVLLTDLLMRSLRAALAARFAQAHNNTLTRSAIQSCVLLVLQEHRVRGYLESFDNLRIYPDADDPTLCRIEFRYTLPAGLHRVALSAQLSV